MEAPTADPKDILGTYYALVRTFSDFLVVAIHTILYERGIYPATTFISTRKYNFPVRQNRHPKVCKWITDAVAAVEAELIKGKVSRVAVVIYSTAAEVMERFMFDVSSFPTVPVSEILTPFEEGEAEEDEAAEDEAAEGEAAEGEVARSKVSLVDIEEQLRATVRMLAYCGIKLGDLPRGCTYTVAIELKDVAEPPIGHPQPWVPSEPSLQTGEKGNSERIGSDLGGAKSMPLRVVEAGEFILDTWIEEGKSKQNTAK